MDGIRMRVVSIERKDFYHTLIHVLYFESESKKFQFTVTTDCPVPERYQKDINRHYSLSEIVKDFKEQI